MLMQMKNMAQKIYSKDVKGLDFKKQEQKLKRGVISDDFIYVRLNFFEFLI